MEPFAGPVLGRLVVKGEGGTINKTINGYIEVLKPRANSLLTFIGVCGAIIAGDGQLSLKLLLVALTILVASAGANGLTNYLDCRVDVLMPRTKHRVYLPSVFIPRKRCYR